MTMTRGSGAAPAVLALALAACADGALPPPPVPLASPVAVSGSSPYEPFCNPAVSGSVLYPGSEVEPHVAVDPLDPGHLVGAWQQDRWQGGGANGIAAATSRDGGISWTRSQAAFTFCSGGLAAAGAHDRASDPWVTFSPDGTVHQIALVFDDGWHGARQAVSVSRSADGGDTWSDPQALAVETSNDLALDKCTITADPVRPRSVYAVWDRLTGLGGDPALQTGAAWLARSTDRGATWEPARVIYDPGPDAQTISNQVAALPDGTLVNLLVILTGISRPLPRAGVAVLRSVDGGDSWSAPIEVAELRTVGTVDPRTGHAVRDGSIVPQIAADPGSGKLHVVWQDSRFSAGARDGIAMATSTDGGLGWTAPIQVNRFPASPAFTPSVAVAASGRLGVSYYDLRANDGTAAPGLWTVRWLATTRDGASWDEVAAGGPFDLRRAPDAGGWFVGDYAGLVGLADSFVPFFSMTGGPGGTDVFSSPPELQKGPGSAAPPARVAGLARPLGLGERVRAMREGPASRSAPLAPPSHDSSHLGRLRE